MEYGHRYGFLCVWLLLGHHEHPRFNHETSNGIFLFGRGCHIEISHLSIHMYNCTTTGGINWIHYILSAVGHHQKWEQADGHFWYLACCPLSAAVSVSQSSEHFPPALHNWHICGYFRHSGANVFNVNCPNQNLRQNRLIQSDFYHYRDRYSLWDGACDRWLRFGQWMEMEDMYFAAHLCLLCADVHLLSILVWCSWEAYRVEKWD